MAILAAVIPILEKLFGGGSKSSSFGPPESNRFEPNAFQNLTGAPTTTDPSTTSRLNNALSPTVPSSSPFRSTSTFTLDSSSPRFDTTSPTTFQEPPPIVNPNTSSSTPPITTPSGNPFLRNSIDNSINSIDNNTKFNIDPSTPKFNNSPFSTTVPSLDPKSSSVSNSSQKYEPYGYVTWDKEKPGNSRLTIEFTTDKGGPSTETFKEQSNGSSKKLESKEFSYNPDTHEVKINRNGKVFTLPNVVVTAPDGKTPIYQTPRVQQNTTTAPTDGLLDSPNIRQSSLRLTYALTDELSPKSGSTGSDTLTASGAPVADNSGLLAAT